VWLRVLPYLQVTYGTDSTFYRLFLYGGMPFGCFFFDALMFLGPFGLLPIIPMPEAMRLFVPAYGATRMIAEVLVEALPQWVMQAVIFVLVSFRESATEWVRHNLGEILFFCSHGLQILVFHLCPWL
jgi:hypothetical protein